jgi:hypothetical protein
MPPVLYVLAADAELSRSDAYDALEVAVEMALVYEAGLLGCSGERRALPQPAQGVKDSTMDLVLAWRQADFVAKGPHEMIGAQSG